jgi:phasin family protein
MVQRSKQEAAMTQTDIRETLIDRSRTLMTQARSYVDASIAYARESTVQLADAIENLDGPVKTLRTAGTRLTLLSQRYAEELLTVQAAMIESALEDSAARLRMVAKAEDLRSLLRDQVEQLPKSRARVSADWRRATAATSKVGRELRELAGETYGHLSEGTTPHTRSTRNKPNALRGDATLKSRGKQPRRRKATAVKAKRPRKAATARKAAASRTRRARKTA